MSFLDYLGIHGLSYIDSNPSEEDLTDALRKGLGRAYLWSQRGLMPRDIMLKACLVDYCFDRQVEEPRGDWLWQLLITGDFTKQLQSHLLKSLEDLNDASACAQLCQIARHMAFAGYKPFLNQLYRIVKEKPVVEFANLAEEELIRLEGTSGLLTAARRHGCELKSREWDWVDNSLIDNGNQWLGENNISECLSTSSKDCEDIKRFYKNWIESRKQTTTSRPKSPKMRLQGISANDVISAAESNNRNCISFRGWGRYASDSELVIVYEKLLDTSDLQALINLLAVFSARQLPSFSTRLLELCKHQDKNVRHRAASAIANNSHPEIRKFALENLETTLEQRYAIEMITANYLQGDEEMIHSVLRLPEDSCELHWTLMSLFELLNRNTEIHVQKLGYLIYETTPCSMCRYYLVKLLSERHNLPEIMHEECQYDVDAGTRALIGGPTWND